MPFPTSITDRVTEILDEKLGEGMWTYLDQPPQQNAALRQALDEYQASTDARIAALENQAP